MNLHDGIQVVFEAMPWVPDVVHVGLAIISILVGVRTLFRLYRLVLRTPSPYSPLIFSGKAPHIEAVCIESVKEVSEPKEETYYQ